MAWAGIRHGSRHLFFLNYQKGLKMPKIKTNRAAAKRFKKTGTGKFVFSKSHASHILTKKSRKRKRTLRQSQIIDKTNRKSLKLLLPNG
jgi:large subunit ribosomal protein L35